MFVSFFPLKEVMLNPSRSISRKEDRSITLDIALTHTHIVRFPIFVSFSPSKEVMLNSSRSITRKENRLTTLDIALAYTHTVSQSYKHYH